MRFGPRTRARSGAVISVSMVPDGWAPPIATERLDDTDVEPGITAFAAPHLLRRARPARARAPAPGPPGRPRRDPGHPRLRAPPPPGLRRRGGGRPPKLVRAQPRRWRAAK